VPLVLLARPPVDDIPAVRAESVQPAQELTRHLFGHGHAKLAFVGDPASSPDAEERWRGFVQAHDDAGADGRWGRWAGTPSSWAAAFGEAAGRKAAGEALDAGATALVCASDEIALGAYGAARARNLQVPQDIAITGWDDIQLARFVSPTLTTVRQPIRELGATAARLLFERCAGRLPDSVVLASEVVIRASCGCEPHRDTQEENE
jgi:LacI family transcriptional regulator